MLNARRFHDRRVSCLKFIFLNVTYVTDRRLTCAAMLQIVGLVALSSEAGPLLIKGCVMSNLEGATIPSNVLPPKLMEGIGPDFLIEFLVTGSIESAQRLCSAAYPTSEICSLDCMPDESWMAEIWYDHLLHEGLGTTEASALTNAILGIFQALNGGLQNEA